LYIVAHSPIKEKEKKQKNKKTKKRKEKKRRKRKRKRKTFPRELLLDRQLHTEGYIPYINRAIIPCRELRERTAIHTGQIETENETRNGIGILKLS